MRENIRHPEFAACAYIHGIDSQHHLSGCTTYIHGIDSQHHLSGCTTFNLYLTDICSMIQIVSLNVCKTPIPDTCILRYNLLKQLGTKSKTYDV